MTCAFTTAMSSSPSSNCAADRRPRCTGPTEAQPERHPRATAARSTVRVDHFIILALFAAFWIAIEYDRRRARGKRP